MKLATRQIQPPRRSRLPQREKKKPGLESPGVSWLVARIKFLAGTITFGAAEFAILRSFLPGPLVAVFTEMVAGTSPLQYLSTQAERT